MNHNRKAGGDKSPKPIRPASFYLCGKEEAEMVRCLSNLRKGEPQINMIYLFKNIKRAI